MLDSLIKISIYNSFKSKELNIPIMKTLDLFEKIIYYNTNNNELDGIRFNWETALTTIYDENSSFADAKKVGNFIFNIEPFLKKILYIIDKSEYEKVVKFNEGLSHVMKFFDVNPFNVSPLQTEYRIAYDLRNLTSHQAAEYPRDIFYTNIEACIVTILCVIHKNYKKLITFNFYSSFLDVNNYMNEIIESFRLKNKRYINLDGSEEIKAINTVVLEDIESISDIDDSKFNEPRKGEIDYLRKKLISEKRMLILAEAGMGKTTTIEYLAYLDAKDKLENIESKIPVLLFLNLLIDSKLTIIDYISKKLSTSTENVRNLLEYGDINLFLDGLNEIPNINYLRSARLAEINNIIDKYKNTFVIISSRPQSNNLVHHIPKFNLLSMDDAKQNMFIEKNCQDDEIKRIVIEAINGNDKIRKIVRTPLFLNIFTKVVSTTRKIPSSEGNLIKVFMNSLFEREINEKNNLTFDIKKANYLLRCFAYDVKEKYKANSGVIESELIDSFTKKMKSYSFNVDAIDYLSIFIDLGILSEKDGLFYFFHESYQDYFYSEELKFLLGM